MALADIANVALKAPSKDEVVALKALVESVETTLPAGERTAGLGGQLKELAEGGWMGSADGQTWSGLLRSSEAAMADGYRFRLAEHLARMICRPHAAEGAGAAVAVGVIQRVTVPGFKGDPTAIADRLKAADCAGAKGVPAFAARQLAVAAERAKGQ